jgi:GNAT superfamily N-acetyltransferase
MAKHPAPKKAHKPVLRVSFRTALVTIDGEDLTEITALFKNEPIATAHLVIDEPYAWLDTLQVLPLYRSQQVGTQLLEKAMRLAVEADCTTFNVVAWRKEAKAFYVACKGMPDSDPSRPGHVVFRWKI